MTAADKTKLDAIPDVPCYGSIYDDNYGTSEATFSSASPGTWYPISGLTAGLYSISSAYCRGYVGSTYSYIAIGAYGAGKYKVSLNVAGKSSFVSSAGSGNWIFAVCIGTTPTHIKGKTFTDSNYQSMSAQGILDLSSGNELRVYYQSDTASLRFHIFNISLSAVRVDN